MDTSRKSLVGVCCCNNCIHFQKYKKNGFTLSVGKCRVTGTDKKRTDMCDNRFVDRGQFRFDV